MKKLLSIIFAASVFGAYAHANNPNCNQHGCTEVPERVLFLADGKLRIYFSSPAPTEFGCTLDHHSTVLVKEDVIGRDLIASVLLTALHTDTRVFIRIKTDSKTGECAVQYVEPQP